jgi:hypothetical protein
MALDTIARHYATPWLVLEDSQSMLKNLVSAPFFLPNLPREPKNKNYQSLSYERIEEII